MLLPHLFSYQGILDLLELARDTVLADRGFTIDKDVILHGASKIGNTCFYTGEESAIPRRS